jgi:putative ABC transport system permease protein
MLGTFAPTIPANTLRAAPESAHPKKAERMDTLRQDVLFSGRSLVRSPGITFAALICLALGIGATTTTYTVTRALVLNPVPAVDGDRLMRVSEIPPNAPDDADGSSPGAFLDWEREARSFEGLAGYRWWSVNLTGTVEPENVIGFQVTPRFFELIGARPVLGRISVATDIAGGENRLVVLGHPLWERRFGGDPAVVGQTVLLNSEPYTVVGVMGEDFIFPPGGELWATLAFSPAEAADRATNRLRVLGRLRRGVSARAAQAEISAIQTRINAAFPAQRAEWTAVAEPIQSWYSRNPRPFALMLLGAVSLVLLIACANVANLLLARATAREREVAVRVAFGAGRGRIVRQLLTESLILALAAGLAGVLLSLWGVLVFRSAIPPELVKFNPGWTRIRVDIPTLGFTVLVSMATAIVFGLVPALQGARPDAMTALREGARGTTASARRRLRSILVVAEIALALMLVIGTGLMLRSFVGLLNADLGFQRQDVLSMSLTLPEQKYAAAEELGVFYTDLQRRLTALPAVAAVGLTNILPMDFADAGVRAASEAHAGVREGDLPIVRIRTVSDGYFDALNVPLLAGRDFDTRDAPDATPVAIVSQLLARRFWPGEDPVGKRIRLSGSQLPRGAIAGRDRWIEVVGLTGDIRHNPNSGGASLQPTLHLPLSQNLRRDMTLLVRTTGDPAAVASAARRAVTAVAPTIAPGEVYTMDQTIRNALSPQRVTAGMLAIFGVIAVVLASVGIYGVMAYSVRRRADEIGVRMVVGAHRGDIVRLVLRQGGRLVVLGIGIGVVGALALARTMTAIIFEVTAYDPATYALAAAFLAVVAMAACWIPARRAACKDPAKLLRYE